jgi:hypothetical protein
MKNMKQLIRNEKGIVLIWFYLLIVMLLTATASIYTLSFQESQLLHMDQARNKALYLAEAGIDRGLQQLRTMGNTGFPMNNVTFGNGTYSIEYNAINANEGIITSTGNFSIGNDQITKIVKAKVDKTPPGVKGSITINDNVEFEGSITIDGRDHVYNTTTRQWEASGEGTFGVSSSGTVNQEGTSLIGGNGIVPTTSPQSAPAIRQNAGSIYANPAKPTPEEALGVTRGSLDQYKTATRPRPGDSGIFYLESSWDGAQLGTEANPITGILIVHNADGNASLKNAHGYFRGLIIADEISLTGNLQVVGGVVAHKTAGGDSGGGAGNAEILYSKDIILSNLPNPQYQIVSWEDTQNTPYTYS